MDDDARNFTSGEFFSDARGKVPPLVTTKFITRDAGNSGMLVSHHQGRRKLRYVSESSPGTQETQVCYSELGVKENKKV